MILTNPSCNISITPTISFRNASQAILPICGGNDRRKRHESWLVLKIDVNLTNGLRERRSFLTISFSRSKKFLLFVALIKCSSQPCFMIPLSIHSTKTQGFRFTLIILNKGFRSKCQYLLLSLFLQRTTFELFIQTTIATLKFLILIYPS